MLFVCRLLENIILPIYLYFLAATPLQQSLMQVGSRVTNLLNPAVWMNHWQWIYIAGWTTLLPPCIELHKPLNDIRSQAQHGPN